MGLPVASFAVTVMVEVPLPAAIGDVALTVDCVADTVPAFTTTVAVCVMATELMVADTVFEPAAVDERLPVATQRKSGVWGERVGVGGLARLYEKRQRRAR